MIKLIEPSKESVAEYLNINVDDIDRILIFKFKLIYFLVYFTNEYGIKIKTFNEIIRYNDYHIWERSKKLEKILNGIK